MNNRKAIKSGFWYTVSNFVVRSIGFITTPIFTRILTKAEFGAYNNFTSWLSIVTIFVTLNLESTLISARYDYEDRFDEYILSILSLSTLSVALWIIIANCFSNIAEEALGLKMPYINAMLIYLLFLPAINLFQARERYYFEYIKTAITSLGLAVGTALLSVCLVQIMQNRLTGRILGSIIPTILIGSALYVFFIVKGKRIKIQYWKYALRICLPFIPHLLSLSLLNSTDRVMIDRWCGSEKTALYSLAYSCGTIVTLLVISLNSAFAPWLGEKLATNDTMDIRNVSKKYISLFLLLAIGIMLISPEALMVLGGESYMEAVYVMAPVSMGCICQFLYTMFVNVEQFKKKTIGMAIASVIAATINVLLNWLFIPRFGYLAAAYTTLVGYLLLLVIHMYLVKKLGLGYVYDYYFVGLSVVIGMCLMIIITLSYTHTFIRFGLLAIYIVVLLIVFSKNKKNILNLLQFKKRG